MQSRQGWVGGGERMVILGAGGNNKAEKTLCSKGKAREVSR